MVMSRRKKVAVITGIVVFCILVVVIIIALISNNNKSELTNDPPPPQTTQEIEQELAKSQRFDDWVAVTKGSDKTLIVSSSLEFARNADNINVSRLDAYRICVQVAREIGDSANQETCYNEGIALAELSSDNDYKTFWQQNLSDVNNGTINSGEDDGSR